jgi:SAM-dependent methyltransferase
VSFYAADLARIHDEGFGDFPRAAACELSRRVPKPALVVELGCGTGISVELLSNAGYDVLGIDISKDMLAIARRRAPRAQLRHGSVWDAELPDCAAVTAIGEVVNYATDERAGATALPELFARVHAALEPGGVFLFDFATPGRAGPPSERRGDDWRVAVTHSEHDRTLERRMTIETAAGTREETHVLHLYEPELVEDMLADAGFSAQRLDRYCDFVWGPGYGAFAAVSGG